MNHAESAVDQIHRAIYARLTGDPELSGMVTGVWDDVPEDADWPYVTIGESIESPDNTHGGFGRDVVATLHVWTKYAGTSQGARIGNRIVGLLDQQPLDIAGHTHIFTRFEFMQSLRDPDPRIRHVVLRFRVATEQQEG